MQKWEYRTIQSRSYPGESELNRLGQDGWELVAVVIETPTACIGFVAYFKRPKS